MEKVYVFGAHSRSRTLAVYLETLKPQMKVEAFVVDNDENNPAELDGKPVLHIDKGDEINQNMPIYIATRGIYHRQIIKRLREHHCKAIFPVTVEMDIELRNRFVREYFDNSGREFKKLTDKAENMSACLYVVKSVFDPVIKTDMSPWEKTIQAGKALTNRSLEGCEIFDNTGENISAYNSQFCELTALYWIWKNAKDDYIGLEHYRRRFLLPDNWMDIVQGRMIDAVLPVPLYVHPSLAEDYQTRHTATAWKTMMSVLKKDTAEYRQAVDFFEKTGCYSPCNMLILRKEVLNELCSWLFPILFEVKERVGTLNDTYQNRYPGFLSERLISFYFFEHSEQYRIVYSDKNFIQQEE